MKKTAIALTVCALIGCSPKQQHPIAQTDNNESTQQYLLHVPSPEWQDQVVYFLMTDRFADGDSSNNDQGANEYDPSKESHYSGGDIQGIINHLDYIQNLGATSVWATPLVANQWWSQAGNYGGYHGYWATDFSEIDAHVGTLETYQQLSHELHSRGMYLIQDIVVNHTGNFFNYEGGHAGYDANDTAKHFVLLEDTNSSQPAPTQAPFDLIDRRNPLHAAADIYNWTPSITDYADPSQQFTYQLATLSDINTTNPNVIDTFKQIYGDWIRKAGVDAFRIDTVRYVEHEFFHHFMHDRDGIHAAAKETGRNNFLAFGEVFDTSKAYSNDAEHRVASYLGSSDKPELNSVISFPLHHELKTVFAQGFPTDHLAYRLTQHMTVYDNPYVIPTFIDNHDMGRFLSSGDIDGFKQALATILTIPGIPVIYQGSAQAMTESRQAMFKGGFMADKDYFDQSTDLYRFIAELANLRTRDKLFTRGTLKMIAANKNGPGLLAYLREYQGRQVLVMFNTSRFDILADNIQIADGAASLKVLYGDEFGLTLNKEGKLTTELAGRSILIAEVIGDNTSDKRASEHIDILSPTPLSVVTQDILLEGQSSLPNTQLHIVKNSRLDAVDKVTTDDNGKWAYRYTARNLGEEQLSLVAYHPDSKATSESFNFTTSVSLPEYALALTDPIDDNHGLTGTITPPTHSQSIGQTDITHVKAEVGGDVLTLTMTMKTITNDWIPANGFDNVAFSIFFDNETIAGSTVLPLLNASMPNDWAWDLGHVVYGWGNTTFSNQHASATHQGDKLGIAPRVAVDKVANQIKLTYNASDLGIPSWRNSKVFISTWDITGEGMYREVAPQSSDWSFGGGHHNDAKIADAVSLVLAPQL